MGAGPHGSDWITEAAIDTYLPMLAHLRELRDATWTRGDHRLHAGAREPARASPFVHEAGAYFASGSPPASRPPSRWTRTASARWGTSPASGTRGSRSLRRLFHAIDATWWARFRRLEEAGRRRSWLGGLRTASCRCRRDESIRFSSRSARADTCGCSGARRRLLGAECA